MNGQPAGSLDTGNERFAGQNLLAKLSERDAEALHPYLAPLTLERDAVLFEPGDDVVQCVFPADAAMVSLVVGLPNGALVETATIGREGAVGGIVSLGHKPAFARAVVQVGGPAYRIATEQLERCKETSGTFRDLLSRYADCLIAQVLQSVACNALHDLERRLSRWLLTAQDRLGSEEVPLTQEFLAEMLGVQRTTVTAVASTLQARGLIRYQRGRITVLDRQGLETGSCPCYLAVRNHFEVVLPGVYPVMPAT